MINHINDFNILKYIYALKGIIHNFTEIFKENNELLSVNKKKEDYRVINSMESRYFKV